MIDTNAANELAAARLELFAQRAELKAERAEFEAAKAAAQPAKPAFNVATATVDEIKAHAKAHGYHGLKFR